VEITKSSGVHWTITQVITDTSPANPTGLYAKSGTGDTVFALPAGLSKIRIQATYPGDSSNFIVWVAGSSLVNTIIGKSKLPANFDGTYIVAGGSIVEITKSSGVVWSFTEAP
jgi:hypothetical protein